MSYLSPEKLLSSILRRRTVRFGKKLLAQGATRSRRCNGTRNGKNVSMSCNGCPSHGFLLKLSLKPHRLIFFNECRLIEESLSSDYLLKIISFEWLLISEIINDCVALLRKYVGFFFLSGRAYPTGAFRLKNWSIFRLS